MPVPQDLRCVWFYSVCQQTDSHVMESWRN